MNMLLKLFGASIINSLIPYLNTFDGVVEYSFRENHGKYIKNKHYKEAS